MISDVQDVEILLDYLEKPQSNQQPGPLPKVLGHGNVSVALKTGAFIPQRASLLPSTPHPRPYQQPPPCRVGEGVVE